ncbi:hypothetical protein Q9L58_009952 [Maublancomyces gigas]|uniref:Uncharacterized protein n=1 Tax=Discina gigas TaxID=1032678 RepID=A0ABR3G5I8_9PEZI
MLPSICRINLTLEIDQELHGTYDQWTTFAGKSAATCLRFTKGSIDGAALARVLQVPRALANGHK